jgi:hypothetical protein
LNKRIHTDPGGLNDAACEHHHITRRTFERLLSKPIRTTDSQAGLTAPQAGSAQLNRKIISIIFVDLSGS